jgi:hypothetical protein
LAKSNSASPLSATYAHQPFDCMPSSNDQRVFLVGQPDDIHHGMYATLSAACSSSASSQSSSMCHMPLFSPTNTLTSTLHYLINSGGAHTPNLTNAHQFQYVDGFVKDDPNPIDRLYSMQNSYFLSKC